MKNLSSLLQFRWRASLIAAVIALTTASGLASPTITVSVLPTKITDQGEDATFTLSISPPAPRKIALTFDMTGTAIIGRDYGLIANGNKSGQLIIPEGSSSVTVTLHSLSDDNLTTGQKNVIFNIFPGARYRVGSPNQAQLIIRDVD